SRTDCSRGLMVLMIWKCSGYGSRCNGVNLDGFIGGELLEPGLQRIDLVGCGFATVDLLPQLRRVGKAFDIPPNMLAGGTHPRVFTIELVVVFEMIEQTMLTLTPSARRQACSGGQIMADFTEYPGPALCGAADHDGIGARIL